MELLNDTLEELQSKRYVSRVSSIAGSSVYEEGNPRESSVLGEWSQGLWTHQFDSLYGEEDATGPRQSIGPSNR